MGNSISLKILEVVILPDGRLDAKNAATYLGFSEKTLAMMRCDGTGPKFLKPGKIFYFKEDLDDWMNALGKFSSTAQAQQGIQASKEHLLLQNRRPIKEAASLQNPISPKEQVMLRNRGPTKE